MSNIAYYRVTYPRGLRVREYVRRNEVDAFSHAPQRDRVDLALFYAHGLMIHQIEIQNVHFQLGFDEEIVQRAKECGEAWKDRLPKINNRLSKTTPVFQFCVGAADARHSMVWKIWSRSNDIYISNTPASEFILGQSGECRWSMSENQQADQNQGDFVWQRPNPTNASAAHVFRIIIAETELRRLEMSESVDRVHFIGEASQGYATYVECYGNLSTAEQSLQHLFSAPRWAIFATLL